MTHQWLPEVFLAIPGSIWPAEEGLPLGTGRVSEFSVEREIVAARMPGQVRTRTGFSIGSANVTIRQADGKPLAPWGRNDRLVATGQPCELYALDEATGERNDLGAWQTKKPAGALTRANVDVELIESQYAGRKSTARLPSISGPVDAAWIVDQLARQAGFHSTPQPNPGTVLSVPMCGTARPDLGQLARDVSADAEWSTRLGRIGLANDPATRPVWTHEQPTATAFRFAVDSPGAVLRFTLPETTGTATSVLDIVAWTHNTWHMRINDGTWVDGTWLSGLNVGNPYRYEVAVEQSGSDIRARIRSTDDDTAWSSWMSVARGAAEARPFQTEIQWQPSQVSALQVGTGPMRWENPTARISLLDGLVDAPWLPEGGDVWTALQQVCDAYAGAGWVSKDRVLTVRNRHEMAGTNRPKTMIDVATRVEDIEWELDADDFADRLEVTWWPVTWGDAYTGDFEQPGVGERLHVPAGRTVTFAVDTGQYVGTLYGWENISSTSTAPFSEWQANTAVDGSGAEVTSGITVTTDQLSPSAARISVTNAGTVDVWMVDFDGSPAMILRGTGLASQESEQTIIYGSDDVDATNKLTIDLGKLVQRRATAEAIAGYLWERVSRPRYRLSGVRMPLDWSRDLGDILTLRHPDSNLVANVLVTADRKRGSAGEIEHRCDLILLPPTNSDFDTAWAGRTNTDFDAVWAGLNAPAFAADPLKTEA